MRQKVRRSLLLFSMVLFPVTMNFLSPFVIVNASFEGVIAGSFLFFILLFVSSLLIGRAFCGWLCPAAGVQEACFPMKSRRVRGRVLWIKYFIWIPWIAAIVLGAVTAGGYRRIDPLYFTDAGISVDNVYKLVIFIFVAGLFFVLSVTVGRRAACHTICWMAPFMVMGKWVGRVLHIPSLRLNTAPSKCTGCKRCEVRCPMSLEVNAMVKKGSMTNRDCILCGECVDACSDKVIAYGFGISRASAGVKGRKVTQKEEPQDTISC